MSDSDFSSSRYLLCKGSTLTLAENGLTSVEMEKEHLSNQRIQAASRDVSQFIG